MLQSTLIDEGHYHMKHKSFGENVPNQIRNLTTLCPAGKSSVNIGWNLLIILL